MISLVIFSLAFRMLTWILVVHQIQVTMTLLKQTQATHVTEILSGYSNDTGKEYYRVLSNTEDLYPYIKYQLKQIFRMKFPKMIRVTCKTSQFIQDKKHLAANGFIILLIKNYPIFTLDSSCNRNRSNLTMPETQADD